jgi:hypothetical protein
MVARHGEEYDWRSDVDVGALYSSGGGKKHGRFSMLNGKVFPVHSEFSGLPTGKSKEKCTTGGDKTA